MTAADSPMTAPGKSPPTISRRTVITVAVAIVAAIAGAVWILIPKDTETTEAAYLQADSSIVAADVRGRVLQVLVRDNQTVRAGDPLVQIDPDEFDARVSSAEADLATAEAGVLAARAAFETLGAEERLAASNIAAARTAISAAEAQARRAQADSRRFADLLEAGVVPRREAEQTAAAAISAASEADRSRATLDVSRQQAGVATARRATLEANLAQAEAQVGRARAALTLARRDRAHTLVRAPVAGDVGDRQVAPGDFVQPGGRLLTVVPRNAIYVTANFKETQVARMASGQSARIRIDALPGVTLTGHVDSLAPGSGSQFSLLPFEPGTGNFTKIVQRIPVRIRLDPGQPALSRLRPGLSTTVTVRVAGDSGAPGPR